jgi:hypothetical protein
MKYSDYKEEQKAFGKINGILTLVAYMLRYRSKEVFLLLIFILAGWIITIIIDPSIALSAKKYIIGLLK